jgi:hypothetical protein
VADDLPDAEILKKITGTVLGHDLTWLLFYMASIFASALQGSPEATGIAAILMHLS